MITAKLSCLLERFGSPFRVLHELHSCVDKTKATRKQKKFGLFEWNFRKGLSPPFVIAYGLLTLVAQTYVVEIVIV